MFIDTKNILKKILHNVNYIHIFVKTILNQWNENKNILNRKSMTQ